MRNTKGQFTNGYPGRAVPIGTVRIRTRHKRGGEQRAWVKVAEPNVWALRARHVWEQARGPIPAGMAIHHRNGDKLNDDLSNLELVTVSEHLERHRDEYKPQIVAALAKARKERRWSTKSATKRTGRPPTYTPEQLAAALAAFDRDEGAPSTVARKFGIAASSFLKILKGR